MSTYSSVASKLLVRIDFKPTLKYFDQMYKIASTLEEEFEHWKAGRNPSMGVLYDTSSMRQLNISGQSISFVTKNPELLHDPYDEIARLFILFLSESEIAEVGRVGIRRLGIRNVNRTYEEFTDKFFDIFYGAKPELRAIVADKLDDVVLVVQGIKEGYHNRNQFGPLKEDEIDKYYGVQEYEILKDIDLDKKTGVFVDTDVYSLTETNLDDALSSIKEALVLCDSMHEDSWNLIQEKI